MEHKRRHEKKKRKTARQTENSSKMTTVSHSWANIILAVNGLNPLIKRYIVAEWIKKPRSTYMLSTRIHLRFKDTHRLKVKWW